MPQPTTIAMELKYCERCGGLYLRPRGQPGAYCAPCARTLELAEAALAPSPLRRGRRPLASTRPADSPKDPDTATASTASLTETTNTGRTA